MFIQHIRDRILVPSSARAGTAHSSFPIRLNRPEKPRLFNDHLKKTAQDHQQLTGRLALHLLLLPTVLWQIIYSKAGTHNYSSFFAEKMQSRNTEALIKSEGSISSASAILKNTSSEKGRAIPGASIELICERLTLAFSANCS